jgi:dienelactone hydrolase
MGRKLIYTFFILAFPALLFAKKKVAFLSEDGVVVTADQYIKSTGLPYVILLHQDNSSRGEFNGIAEKIMELGYNCLAVDLRKGGRFNYVENETSLDARYKGKSAHYIDAELDLQASIAYAFKKSGKAVVLLGGTYSASLCIKAAINNARVSAIVVFHPGEYLKPSYTLQEHTGELDKPVFVAANKSGMPHAKTIFENTDPAYLTFFYPAKDDSVVGARVLDVKNKNQDEYWLALLMFFSKL